MKLSIWLMVILCWVELLEVNRHLVLAIKLMGGQP